jgi:hypothetical protein
MHSPTFFEDTLFSMHSLTSNRPTVLLYTHRRTSVGYTIREAALLFCEWTNKHSSNSDQNVYTITIWRTAACCRLLYVSRLYFLVCVRVSVMFICIAQEDPTTD